ncbi:MAG TPA: hypothetical protein VLW49_11340 [Gaiellaceae bacterium]|nr:hypothetical protein [Gaiellaceae bacterium]
MPSVRLVIRAAVIAAAAATVAALAVQPSTAHAATTRNLCGLLSSSALAGVHVHGPCKRGKTQTFSESGVTVGTLTWVRWGSLPRTTGLVTANIYDINSSYLSLAKERFTRLGGTHVAVGKWGLMTTCQKTQAGITFGVGDYIVQVAVTTPGAHPLKSKGQMQEKATSLAAQLAKGL